MTELEKTVEALKRCIPAEQLKKAMTEVENLSPAMSPGVAGKDDAKSVEVIIDDLLTKVGMPSNIKGHRFTSTAIRLLIEQPDMADYITGGLYPQVARIHGTTGIRVERGIRHGVEVTWIRGDLDVLYNIFGNTVNRNKGKPTNSEFLTRMANVVRRKLN